MTPRESLQNALAAGGFRVFVHTPTLSPQLAVFPVSLGDVPAAQLETKLDEIAGRLGVPSVRGGWQHGSSMYCLELPRPDRQTLSYAPPAELQGALPLLIGQTTAGRDVCADLADMPHLLIAGQTGSGKSNALNVMLATLILKRSPAELRLVLLDPKAVELAPFADAPHNLCPPLADVADMLEALEALVGEMQRRYTLLQRAHCRDIASYNAKHRSTGDTLPRLVVCIDELADLMATCRKDAEPPLQRLAQKARAAGIHLILATQRISEDTLRPSLKINIPARLAFKCDTGASSRAILDAAGAQHLTGHGDGLYKTATALERIICPYISDADIEDAVLASQLYGTPSIDVPGLSAALSTADHADALEALLSRAQHIAPRDLERAGIAKNKSQAKLMVSELRAAGRLGSYNAALQASPVLGRDADRDGKAADV